MRNDALKPIHDKIDEWIFYIKNNPKDYASSIKFRQEHDLDCVLTGGNLHADTIFSLFTPLRRTLVSINGYDRVSDLGVIKKSVVFLKNLQASLETYLPEDDALVKKLVELFEIGRTRANVMLQPKIGMNQKRGMAPYFDYVPHFIVECFAGGDFSSYFKSDEEFIEWIKKERLESLFDGEIKKECIRDLACTGNVRDNLGTGREQLLRMFDNYIGVIRSRI